MSVLYTAALDYLLFWIMSTTLVLRNSSVEAYKLIMAHIFPQFMNAIRSQ